MLETRLTEMYDLCSKDVCTHGVLGGGTSSDDLGVSADPAWSAFSVARRELALRTPPPTLHTHTHTHTHTHSLSFSHAHIIEAVLCIMHFTPKTSTKNNKIRNPNHTYHYTLFNQCQVLHIEHSFTALGPN